MRKEVGKMLVDLVKGKVVDLKRTLLLITLLAVVNTSLWAQSAPTQVCLDLMKLETCNLTSKTVQVNRSIKVSLNGEIVALSDPILSDEGTTLLPIRAIGDLLGCEVDYNKESKVAMLQYEETTLEVPLGYSFGVVNGEKKEIPNGKKSIVYQSITYLPVRFVSEALGVKIEYNVVDQTIDIITETLQLPTVDLAQEKTQLKENTQDQLTKEAAESKQQKSTYQFRKPEYLTEHFNKHGSEFQYTTEEEYLAGANRVISSKESLHKIEAEDGDDIYYLEATNEIVFVSTDGYIRTYFKPDDGIAYFNKQ